VVALGDKAKQEGEDGDNDSHGNGEDGDDSVSVALHMLSTGLIVRTLWQQIVNCKLAGMLYCAVCTYACVGSETVWLRLLLAECCLCC
jgi:hypothetical protein